MPDEPVFFILAASICPALFLIGAAASGILLLRGRTKGNEAEPQQDAPPDADKLSG